MVLDLCVGGVLGFLSGLGVGGGSLLMLWLTAVRGLEPKQAGAINLLFYLASAGICCLLRRRSIPWQKLLPAALAGMLTAALCAGLQLPGALLRRILAVLMLYTGFRELKGKK